VWLLLATVPVVFAIGFGSARLGTSQASLPRA
jgi:hypothetical protein